jgi:cellulase
MNPYRHKAFDYYGPGMTVVTSFPANEEGVLQEVVRTYIQDGKVIQNAAINVTGPIDDAYCARNGAEMFGKLGAMKGMGESMTRGMVLAMSIWWDEGGFMQWLDSGEAGPCSATEGDPKVIVGVEPNPTVKFSQIKWGEIGSTTTLKNRPGKPGKPGKPGRPGRPGKPPGRW